MNPKTKQIIIVTSLIVVGIYFFILGVFEARSFLIPLTVAILLSMVMLPVTEKFESWGIPRGFSVLFSDLLILGFCVGLFFLIGIQVNNITENWPEYEKKLKPQIEQAQKYIEKKTGIPPEEQNQELKKTIENGKGQSGKAVGKFLSGFFTTTGNFLLVFVYIFFFMYYRKKFKKSVLRFFPLEKREQAAEMLSDFGKVSQQYLFGRFILIIILAILYSIGLSISGVKHAVFISIIAAVLSLIPYIGNILGLILAILLGAITQGGAGGVIGVIITFSIAQFVESYILEPYVVGQRVDLNPAFTIIGVVAGGAVWGIAGMIIAIPLLGISKVVFDKIKALEPAGYLLGEEGIDKGESWVNQVKTWFQSKKNK